MRSAESDRGMEQSEEPMVFKGSVPNFILCCFLLDQVPSEREGCINETDMSI